MPFAPSASVRRSVHVKIPWFSLMWSRNGTVLIDTGRVVFPNDGGPVLAQSGQHPIDAFFNGDTSALQPLCDALAG